ncbi:hypothetical protein J3459_018524, partial [Metarhizium acridum]
QNSRSGNENVGHLVQKPQPSLSAALCFITGSHHKGIDLPSPLFHSQSTVFEGAWQPPTLHENRWYMLPIPPSFFHSLLSYTLSERPYPNINVVNIVPKTKA